MVQYNIIAENEEYTVVSEYRAEYGKPDKYQSEAMLEKDFITMDKNVYSVYDQFFSLWLAFKGLI